MQQDEARKESLREIERRIERLEFMTGTEHPQNQSLSSAVETLVRDVNFLAQKHPQIEQTLQFMKKQGLEHVFEDTKPLEYTYEMVGSRLGTLAKAVDSLAQLETLEIPNLEVVPFDPRDCEPIIEEFDELSVRNVDLLTKWLEAVKNSNQLAGEVEAKAKEKRL